MTDQSTRHVTLMVTHPGGAGHLTLDHHIPADAADELSELVGELAETRGGLRWVVLFAKHDAAFPWLPMCEVDDVTADRVTAAMRAHMPDRDERELGLRAAERDDPHPADFGPRSYIHLTYGAWEASGHQHADIQVRGCDEPIPMREVIVRDIDGEQLVGYELGDCPTCGPGQPAKETP
jgi:hypothetical protein